MRDHLVSGLLLSTVKVRQIPAYPVLFKLPFFIYTKRNMHAWQGLALLMCRREDRKTVGVEGCRGLG